jgi:hypothetical protein
MATGPLRRGATPADAEAVLTGVLEDLATLFTAADGEAALRVALATVCIQLGWRYGEAFTVAGGRLVPGPAWSIQDDPALAGASTRVARERERGENLPLRALVEGKRVWSAQNATSVAVAAPVVDGGRTLAVLHFVLPHIQPRRDAFASSLIGAVSAALALRLGRRE